MKTKKKVLRCAENVQRAYINMLPAIGVTMAMIIQNTAFAATSSELTKLIEMIITAVAMLLGVFGVVRLVTAVAEWGSAGADDGPAKAKAKNDLAMAAMIFAIGVILGLSKSAIAGLVSVSALG